MLPDAAIVEAALALPADAAALVELPGFVGRGARRFARQWTAAVERARQMPESALPPPTLPPDGPPPARSWPERDPAAAARLAAMRAALGEQAEQLHMPVENILAPDTVRRLAWAPPEPADAASVTGFLRERGARDWQVELALPLLLDSLTAAQDEPGPARGGVEDPAEPAATNGAGPQPVPPPVGGAGQRVGGRSRRR